MDLPSLVRNIILGCWHSDPLERPNFSDIRMMLKYNRTSPVVVDNSTKRDATIVTVEQWSNRQHLTLLEAMQKLMDMDLRVLKASYSSSTDMVTQYFEVTGCRGRKICDEGVIGNMSKALSVPVTMKWVMKWVTDSIGRSIDVIPCAKNDTIISTGEENPGLERLGVFADVSAFLAASTFQVHTIECWTRKGRVECVICVGGGEWESLLEYMPNPTRATYDYEIQVCWVALEDFIHLKNDLRNLMFKRSNLKFKKIVLMQKGNRIKSSTEGCPLGTVFSLWERSLASGTRPCKTNYNHIVRKQRATGS